MQYNFIADDSMQLEEAKHVTRLKKAMGKMAM